MSRENVEAVRRAWDAVAHGELAFVEELIHPDAEWRPALTAGGDLERAVYRGPRGFRQYFRDIDETFDETRFELMNIEAASPTEVFVRGRVTARGRASGIPLDVSIWAVYELRGGKVVRAAGYLSEAEALEAVRQRE